MTLTPTRTCEASTTTIAVERPHGGGRAVVTFATAGPADRPVLRPVLQSSDALGATVCLIPDGALLLSGDAIDLRVTVGPGASLRILEPAGTVAFAMDGGRASWSVSIDLAPTARLVWAGEPFVVASGADITRTLDVTMGWDARLAMREVLVLGRHGEGPGVLNQDTRISGPNGQPVLVENLMIDAESSPLLLRDSKAIGTVTLIGGRLASGGTARFDLAAEGTLVRRLSPSAHETVLAETWAEALKTIDGG